jgi:uncharacterized protein (TIGR02421 family)
MRAEQRDAALARALEVIHGATAHTKLLDAIAWPRRVEREFFASGAEALPKPENKVDRDRVEESISALTSLEQELAGDHVLLVWLRSLARSHRDAYRLVLAMGTRGFYDLSVELYGGARTTALDHDTSNLDFARHISKRLKGADRALPATLDTDALIQHIERRLSHRPEPFPLAIVRDPDLSAKVICGMTRLRVREGAYFSRDEADGLYDHEVETHALTAQNGDAQSAFPLLRSGGPRSTRTQEGLAVFAELYGHSLSSPRLARIATRVELVAMAEDGASFLDVYRHLVETGSDRHEAYLDTQRIFRGGAVEGGAPFTKDACYLAGLVDVYNFLRVAVRAGSRVLGEALITGRLDLEDLDAIVWLRGEGVLAPPKLVPKWLDRWDALLSYFAFTSFLNEIDLPPIEARHEALVQRAVAASA